MGSTCVSLGGSPKEGEKKGRWVSTRSNEVEMGKRETPVQTTVVSKREDKGSKLLPCQRKA